MDKLIEKITDLRDDATKLQKEEKYLLYSALQWKSGKRRKHLGRTVKVQHGHWYFKTRMKEAYFMKQTKAFKRSVKVKKSCSKEKQEKFSWISVERNFLLKEKENILPGKRNEGIMF